MSISSVLSDETAICGCLSDCAKILRSRIPVPQSTPNPPSLSQYNDLKILPCGCLISQINNLIVSLCDSHQTLLSTCYPGCKLRLVGIEPNPGPPKKNKVLGTLGKLATEVSATIGMVPENKGKRNNRRKNKNKNKNKKHTSSASQGSSLTKNYKNSRILMAFVNALDDPFHCVAPFIGFGSMIPLVKRVAYWRQIMQVGGSSGINNLIMFQPSYTGLRLYQNNVGSSIVASTAPAIYNCNNYSNLAAAIQTARPVVAGIRIRIYVPATAAPPQVFCGNIFDTFTNITNLSYNAIAAESQMMPLLNVNNTYQVNWRPADANDFTVGSTIFGYGTSTSINTACIYVSSVVAYTCVVEAILQTEANSGIDVAGTEVDSSDSIADELPNIETAARLSSQMIGPEAFDFNPNNPSNVWLSAVSAFARTAGRRSKFI